MINLLRVIQQVNFLIEKMMSSLYRCKLDDDEQFVGAQESHARCTQCRRVCRSTNWTYTKTFSSRIARTKMDDRLWSCPARILYKRDHRSIRCRHKRATHGALFAEVDT